MTSPASRRTPVLVVSGFLGSGKTTLVRSLLERSQRDGVRTAIISNEFGALGIDEALLAGAGGVAGSQMVELAGGCVCCQLSDELVETLVRLHDTVDPDRIIIETSGVALPFETQLHLYRPAVRDWIGDDACVVVVDATGSAFDDFSVPNGESGVSLERERNGTFEQQVQSADLIVLSKVDLADAGAMTAALLRLAPDTPVLPAANGDIPVDVFFPAQPRVADARRAQGGHDCGGLVERHPHEHGHTHEPFVSEEIAVSPGQTPDEVERQLLELRALRVKGFVQTTLGPRIVQGVGRRVELVAPGALPVPAGLLGRVVVIRRARFLDSPRAMTVLTAGPDSARALNPTSAGMQHSMILGIAGDVRARIAAGQKICNLTVGDFDPKQFPIPDALRDATTAALADGQTNYPPAEGIAELRQAVCDWYARELGVSITPDWVVVASGARPVMYATYRLFLEPGDEQLFPVPSWNCSYYGQITGARAVPIPTTPEQGFFPDPKVLPAYFRTAQLFSLNSPLNPTGTAIAPERLAAIARALLDENRRRSVDEPGRRPLMWMWDQVYWQLCFGETKHVHPCTLVPEVAPYVVTVDAISKAFAATGLRVGWAVLPPPLASAMKALIGHIGAWAPRPEQVGTAQLLNNPVAMTAFRVGFHAAIEARLDLLHTRLTALGIPHIAPQGAIYLSVRFEAFGRPGVGGVPMQTNDDIRRWLLEAAGVAIVPFQAFEMAEDTGWFRISVGAVSLESLDAAMERLSKVW